MINSDFKTTLPLFPYQKTGAEFLHRIGSGLLGDSPGTGKTIQALAIMEANNSKKNLILCPKVLVYQWEQEIKHFLPNWQNIIVVNGNAGERKKYYQRVQTLDEFTLIMGYETARIDIELLKML